jgi:hypothetical protein
MCAVTAKVMARLVPEEKCVKRDGDHVPTITYGVCGLAGAINLF